MNCILLVDDNRAHSKLIEMGLLSSGMELHITSVISGEEAIQYLKKTGKYASVAETPAMVLLDLRMPKMDGIEVLKIIKDDRALDSVPVIILTTSEAPADIKTAYENRANSYLVKPDSLEGMSDMMAETARYWIGLNRRAV